MPTMRSMCFGYPRRTTHSPRSCSLRCGHDALDALALARLIRSDANLVQPKLALIGLPSDRPQEDALQSAGIDAWLSEPVRDQALLRILTTDREARPHAGPAGHRRPRPAPPKTCSTSTSWSLRTTRSTARSSNECSTSSAAPSSSHTMAKTRSIEPPASPSTSF